jgi:hypothetical protein
MKRRTVLISALGALGAAALPLAEWFSRRSYDSDVLMTSAYPVLLSLIATEDDIMAIGESMPLSILDGTDGHELTQAILEDIPMDVYQPKLNASELKLRIAKKIQMEFQKGEIQIIKGWVLSKTEVMQCRVYHWLAVNS